MKLDKNSLRQTYWFYFDESAFKNKFFEPTISYLEKSADKVLTQQYWDNLNTITEETSFVWEWQIDYRNQIRIESECSN